MDLVYRRGCSPSKYREVHYNWTVYDKRKNQEAKLQGRGDGGKENRTLEVLGEDQCIKALYQESNLDKDDSAEYEELQPRVSSFAPGNVV